MRSAFAFLLLAASLSAAEPTAPRTNRLAHEHSPYLLQHAHNPVDWYPWGEEAFARARRENKPIFLSVGYSTCHWCHVMAHESFEDESVAQLLNDSFVWPTVWRKPPGPWRACAPTPNWRFVSN